MPEFLDSVDDIYLNASRDIVFTTGGSEQMRLSRSGIWTGPGSDKKRDVTKSPYSVATTASHAANATAIMAAWADSAADGRPCYLPGLALGASYPCATLTMPTEPVRFYGDGMGVSLLQFPLNGGSALTYNPAGAATNPYSRYWLIHDLAFYGGGWTGSATKGWDFSTNWTNNAGKMVLVAENCFIHNFNGTGIDYVLSGAADAAWLNVVASENSGVGMRLGSDFHGANLVSHDNGLENFYWDVARLTQGTNIKSYNGGKLGTSGRQAGIRFTGAGGVMLTNVYTQDDFGPGLWIQSSNTVTIHGLRLDRVVESDVSGNVAALVLQDVNHIKLFGVTATRSAAGSEMVNAIKLIDAGTNNYANRIEIDQVSGGFGMAEIIDPSSNLSGTTIVVGSGGGVYVNAPAAGVVTPDPYRGERQRIAVGANVTTVAPPFYQKGLAAVPTGAATGNFTVSIASPGVVTFTGHGLLANDPVIFTTSGALPTGLAANTWYWVKTVVDADTFTVSATGGGAAINTSGTQSGTHSFLRDRVMRGYEGARLILHFVASGSFSVSGFDVIYTGQATGSPAYSMTSGQHLILRYEYDATLSKWVLMDSRGPA